MLVAGVTGGIGSGKSTLCAMLAERGAEVIDADEIGRRALDPGTPAWRAVVDQFGDDILSDMGMHVDRKRLASIVFNNRDKLAALNAILHPEIMRRIADTLEILRGTGEIVVLDAALIVEIGLAPSLDVLVVVVADEDVRRVRLKADRGMSDIQVDERIRAQAKAETLLEKADIVVHNNGSTEELAAEADRVWAELEKRRSER
jgi:dephospho-CoA kinase